MRRRDRWSVLLIGLLLVGLGLAMYFMTIAPPAAVRYLPPASGIVYIDFKPIRAAGILARNPVQPEEEYKQFIDATGIDFERDLDEAAFALNEIPLDQSSQQRRISYSEVFVGHFDPVRFSEYLTRIATEKEHYRGREIFNIQMPGHTDRVCILGKDMVAVSSALGSDEIHAIIDRSRQSLLGAMPFGENALVRKYYAHVPMGSLIWAVLRMKSSPDDEQGLDLRHLAGYGFLFPPKTVLVASSRYTGTLQLRAEAFTEKPADAQKITSSFDALLHILRTPTSHPSKNDTELAAFFDSIKIEQRDSRAVLTATLPEDLLKQIIQGKTQ